MKENVLVTGANGHLGLNTVRSLLKKGHLVRAFVRKTADLRGLQGLPLDVRYGDVRELTTLTEAAQGCSVIIHHAAVYKIWAKTTEEILAPAMQGTRHIYEAASRAGIKRLIYTSSTYAIGVSTDPDKVLTAQDWNTNENMPYSIAKTKSEQLAWELSAKYGIPTLTLCPGAILGRYDYRVTPSNRLILDMLKGMGMTVENVLSFIDARDAGEIHALAVERGTIGKRYILTNDAVPMKALGNMVQQLTGKKVWHLPFSRGVNIASTGIMELVARVTGWDPAFTVGLARELSHRYAQFDNSATLQDFAYTLYPHLDTIQDTIRWFAFIKSNELSKSIVSKFPPEAEWLELAAASRN